MNSNELEEIMKIRLDLTDVIDRALALTFGQRRNLTAPHHIHLAVIRSKGRREDKRREGVEQVEETNEGVVSRILQQTHMKTEVQITNFQISCNGLSATWSCQLEDVKFVISWSSINRIELNVIGRQFYVLSAEIGLSPSCFFFPKFLHSCSSSQLLTRFFCNS